MNNLKDLIYKMLTESTGEAMGDSGGAYGRHRQRNQKKSHDDFENEPEVMMEITKREYDGNEKETEHHTDGQLTRTIYHTNPRQEGDTREEMGSEYDMTISVYHYLIKAFDLDDICDQYNALPCENWDSDYGYGVSSEQESWLNNNGFVAGDTINTYNGDSNLSQVLQYTYIKQEGSSDQYVLLQIHQGCDVRGGYTDAKMFLLEDNWMPSETIMGDVVLKDGRTMRVSTMYDGIRLRCDDDEDGKFDDLYEKEIDPDNIADVDLDLSL